MQDHRNIMKVTIVGVHPCQTLSWIVRSLHRVSYSCKTLNCMLNLYIEYLGLAQI